MITITPYEQWRAERDKAWRESFPDPDLSLMGSPDATRDDYFLFVVTEIREVCLWSRRDFLGEVGPFVREFRGFGSHQERTAA